jgi:hypothetical protein
MNIQDWGAVGELLGAVAVVVTLIYLAKQIRLHTTTMDEARKLALAQTYQMRSDALQDMVVKAATSDLGAIIVKLTGQGYPTTVDALASLSDEERGRFRLWQIAQQTHWDNMFDQYQQGYLEQEYYEDSFRERVLRLAPTWRALGISGGRASFFAEIDRLEREAATAAPAGDGAVRD